MSELDSFFAKKDKNKKSKKKPTTVNVVELVSQIDHGTGGIGGVEDSVPSGTVTLKTTSSKAKEKAEKRNENQETRPEDDMWKEIEEPNEVDYSDLKIQSLQISEEAPKGDPNHPDNTDTGENAEDECRNKTVWQLHSDSAAEAETLVPVESPVAEVEGSAKTPAGKYVPPSQRGVMAATSTRGNMRVMPEISNEQHFPSLAAASEAEKLDRTKPPTTKPKKGPATMSGDHREYSTPRYSAPRTGGDSYDTYDTGSSRRSDYGDRSTRDSDRPREYTERSREVTHSDRDSAWRTPATRGGDDAWGVRSRGGEEGWRQGPPVERRYQSQTDDSDSCWRTPSRQDEGHRRDNRDEWRRPDDRQAPPDDRGSGGYVPPSRREGGYAPVAKREESYTPRGEGGYAPPSRRGEGAYVPPSQRHQPDEMRNTNQYAVLSENN